MTYRELLRRLKDLDGLADPVDVGGRGCMSSTDRTSRNDAATDTYVEWGANQDGSGRVRGMIALTEADRALYDRGEVDRRATHATAAY